MQVARERAKAIDTGVVRRWLSTSREEHIAARLNCCLVATNAMIDDELAKMKKTTTTFHFLDRKSETYHFWAPGRPPVTASRRHLEP